MLFAINKLFQGSGGELMINEHGRNIEPKDKKSASQSDLTQVAWNKVGWKEIGSSVGD